MKGEVIAVHKGPEKGYRSTTPNFSKARGLESPPSSTTEPYQMIREVVSNIIEMIL